MQDLLVKWLLRVVTEFKNGIGGEGAGGGLEKKNRMAQNFFCSSWRQSGLLEYLWLGKIPWRGAWKLTPVFLPGDCHGQKSLEGYSPQGHRELDTTEVTWHIHISLESKTVSFLSPLNLQSWTFPSVLLILLFSHAPVRDFGQKKQKN